MPAAPGFMDQSNIDQMCSHCESESSGSGVNPGANDAAHSNQYDPCQPSAQCASQATPTMAECCASSPKQWRVEVSSNGSCWSVSCQPAKLGLIDQWTIDLICNQCESEGSGSGVSTSTNDAADPNQDDPFQRWRSASCAQATPTVAECCAMSPKQYRFDVSGHGSCWSVSCQPAKPRLIEQWTIDLMCN